MKRSAAGDQKRGCCPMDELLRILAGPWTMYIVWVLRSEGPTRFGALKRRIEGVSARVLTERLRLLEAEGLVARHYEPTVPPQVTYRLTPRAQALNGPLDQLNVLARKWHDHPAIRRMEGAAGGQPTGRRTALTHAAW